MRRDRLGAIYVIDHEIVPTRAHLGLIFYARVSNQFYVVVEEANGGVVFEVITSARKA